MQAFPAVICAANPRERCMAAQIMEVAAINVYVPWDVSVLDFFSRFIRFRIGVSMFPAVAVFAVIVAISVLVKTVKSYLK